MPRKIELNIDTATIQPLVTNEVKNIGTKDINCFYDIMISFREIEDSFRSFGEAIRNHRLAFPRVTK